MLCTKCYTFAIRPWANARAMGYRMQVQPWHQVLMLLASARIKLLGCPACNLFRWLAPVSSDCSCCIASPRGAVITR